MSMGGTTRGYYKAAREKIHNCLRSPPYHSTSTSSQAVCERAAQPCTQRWRFPEAQRDHGKAALDHQHQPAPRQPRVL
jgi:hypothetical protein